MKNSQLAQEFANGATKGKGNNMFIEGNAIFSYGHHFPMAVRVRGQRVDFLFNIKKYSVSTSKHQSYVRSALSGYNVLEVGTKTIQEAVGDKELSVLMVFEQPENSTQLYTVIENFLRRKGIKKVDVENKNKLFEQLKAIQLGEAL